jgi:hypothetical protein|tara:strand:+ start:247 stop:624 length:378 start_codon:yes stop_codon:yes gene_type:complete
MAHFAKIGKGNIVEQVIVVSNDIATNEEAGINFINELYKSRDVWKQTSFNTIKGEHILGGTPLRKNYAAPGYFYDDQRDAFIPPKPFPSWILDEETCTYNPPIERPDEDNSYDWNEDTQSWDLKA